MIIRDMFSEDINRKINGVIKVDQSEEDVIEQEIREYVITRELKKLFTSFFNHYSASFDEPTADVGVWISGFFGSGKSHFLKMLSYILENRPVGETTTVEHFREKFQDDPGTFMLIDRAARCETETILFNIDIEGSSEKDKTAVLRVFAKTFYNHLGLMGENRKVLELEKHIRNEGKTEEFAKAVEKHGGKPWTEIRRGFSFNGKVIIPAMMEVLGMKEKEARHWFSDREIADFSIASLVEDIKTYLEEKREGFRLLFMIDEVGQYVGTETDYLLNLQSLTEKIGSECMGRVWVICTGQEAIDEIIKVRSDEFSRIQARFKTRLSLTSSSVDEVIQKRILHKTPEAERRLEKVYDKNDSVLRNLFTFTDSVKDIRGYGGASEFAVNFPFVPYQFILMQKIFPEVRKHGNAGKHFSGAERSMLSGFQEAVQKIQDRDENALIPLFRFYDTIHSFLDGSIRRVIERCDRAASDGNGIDPYDVEVLKLLYLVRYIDDIKACVDNIVILMADDIQTDKIRLREKVRASLERLESQNYIGRSDDCYSFLTDEEQDIAREIHNTTVDTASIVQRISSLLFGEIYPTKKFRHGKYDFSYDQAVDGMNAGATGSDMKLKFLTVAADASEKTNIHLMKESIRQAVVVLAETPYYESLENAMKIRKYVKQRNVEQLPKSVQEIIRGRQSEAARYEQTALIELKKAVADAVIYVNGERYEVKDVDAKSKIDQAMECLVTQVYRELGLIKQNAESDEDILAALRKSNVQRTMVEGTEPNHDAAVKMEEYLDLQRQKNLPTSMADIQRRYQAIPYGWKEIDIALVAAMLIYEQKVTVRYGGATVQPNNPKLPDMLRKKSEIGKTEITVRDRIRVSQMNEVREFLREYFDIMDVPNDEDGLIDFIVKRFTEHRAHFEELRSRYTDRRYPDRPLVEEAVRLTDELLSQQKDNIALIQRVIQSRGALLENRDAVHGAEEFFRNQVRLFDEAVSLEKSLQNDLSYIRNGGEAELALREIQLITDPQAEGRTVYRRIPELTDLMKTVRAGHDELLAVKRAEILEIVRQCGTEIHAAAHGGGDGDGGKGALMAAVTEKSDAFFAEIKRLIDELGSLALLDGLAQRIWSRKDTFMEEMERLRRVPKSSGPNPPAQEPSSPSASDTVKRTEPTSAAETAAPLKNIKLVYRQSIFPSKTLESPADIDAYVEIIRKNLNASLKDCDGIKIS